MNSGNWLQGSSYVEIDNGKVELKKWESWNASLERGASTPGCAKTVSSARAARLRRRRISR